MKITTGGILWIGRDAKTGLFIPVAQAKKRKATAIVQKIKLPRRLKNGRFARRGVN